MNDKFTLVPHPTAGATIYTPERVATPSPQPASLDAEYGELRALAANATPGPWEVDTTRNEGQYGSGENPGCGFDSYTIFDASGNVLADTLNSDAEVHVDGDEDGMCAWDEIGRRNMDYIAACHPAAILAILDSRAQLVERVAVLEAAPCEVWIVSSKTFSAICATEKIAQSFVSSQPASVGGGMNVTRTSVIGSRLATPHPHADEAAKVESK